jgi:NhaP-type Na+/H+ or K+/H+ antiporter
VNAAQERFAAVWAGIVTFVTFLAALGIYATVDRIEPAALAFATAALIGIACGAVAGRTWLALMRRWWGDDWNKPL